jgi:predicted nucleic acid-binding protein
VRKKIIVNNTVLSNFASVSRLDLLEKIFDEIYISLEVYDEIKNGIEKGYLFHNLLSLLT